jgi:VCBS repeat-containing protein
MKNIRVKIFATIKAAFAGGLLLSSIGCGMLNSLSKFQPPGPMSTAGNWQFDLMDSNSNVAALATGFLQQSGSAVTGAFDVSGCANNVSVSGTVEGNNGPDAISLSSNVDGQMLQIVGSGIGTIAPGTAIEGTYTVGALSCSISGLTATVSAQQINPISGAFHGSVQPKSGGTFNISGNVTQGQNTGAVTAALSGTGTVTGSACFSSVNLSGTISGTSVVLTLTSSDGSQTAELTASPQSAAGQLNNGTPGSFTITQLSGAYAVSTGSCAGDAGTFDVTFP